MARLKRTACRILLLTLMAATIGCRDHAKIAVYEVPKEASTVSVPKRMLAAMIRRDDQTWFFKLTGPESAVTPEIEAFVQLIRSVQFDPQTGRPKWETPQGWKLVSASDGIRFATIEKPTSSGKLEISVTVLPTGPDWDAYVLQNVNRWRGQLGLPPADPSELEKLLIRMPLESDPGAEAIMVNIEGSGSGGMGTAGSPPPARDTASAVSPATPPAAASRGSDEIEFDLPAGWKRTNNDTFSRYAFVVEGEDAAARVTITPLRAAGGADFLLANVNRWRGQVGLPPLSPDQVAAELKDIPFLGGTGKLVVALPAEAAGRNGILGVIGITGGTAWFVKMTGDAEFLQSKRSEFEQFVQSIRLKREASS